MTKIYMLFSKPKKERIFIDTLYEWRNTEVGEFKLLDHVWITRTIEQSKHSHPDTAFPKEIDFQPIEGIIIGSSHGTLFTNKIGIPPKYDGWSGVNDAGLFMKDSEGYNMYTFEGGYKVLLKDGTVIDAHTVKKSNGEFQEEFELMESIEKKKIELLATQEQFTEKLLDMEALLKEARNKNKNIKDRILELIK